MQVQHAPRRSHALGLAVIATGAFCALTLLGDLKASFAVATGALVAGLALKDEPGDRHPWQGAILTAAAGMVAAVLMQVAGW